MAENMKGKRDIKAISAMLTEENKRYVIAVANALLFTQKKKENKLTCETTYRRIT